MEPIDEEEADEEGRSRVLNPDASADRKDNLRVTALELAIKFRPGVTPAEVVMTADRFRVFLSGSDEAVTVDWRDPPPFTEWSGLRGAFTEPSRMATDFDV